MRFEDSDHRDPNAFTKDDAIRIQDFVEHHMTQGVQVCLVHCHMGWSRSPGVAAALSDFYNEECGYFFRHFNPNAHVFRVMLETLYEERNLI
jgi:predicted protein tyrosine phosphatase